MVMVTMCTIYLMPSDSFFAHYMPRFMHLWWLLIIIWISHDILRAVSYFLYHYYFINLQIACKGMLTNSAKQWFPFLAMNLENFKKYLQVCYQNFKKHQLKPEFHRSPPSMGSDTGWMARTGFTASSGCSWSAAQWPSSLSWSRMPTCK